MPVIDKLRKFAENNLNILLVGHIGVGKTTQVKQVVNDLGLRWKYYSASTLDPWADLVGVPVPDKKNNSLSFYRPRDLEEAEFLMFDELNRAHPRVLNAVLEIIQFKTINGTPLPNLKMVWAAINPPGDKYDVEDLDPALLDRFHAYLFIEPEFNMEYMITKMQEATANLLRTWWREDLDENQRQFVTPRRLEYLGLMIDLGLDWNDCLPKTVPLPVGDLRNKIKVMKHGESGIVEVSKDTVLLNPNIFIERIKEDPSEALRVKEVLIKFSVNDLYVCRDLIEALPKDLVKAIAEPRGNPRFETTLDEFYKWFHKDGIDVETQYPKIYETFTLYRFVI